MQTRRAGAEDVDAIVTVLRRSIRELCFEDHRDDPRILDNWLANKTAVSVSAWIESEEDFCTVAVATDGDIVGFGMLSRAGELLLLYVSPEAAGQGAGYALLVAMEHQARTWGLKAITLDSTLTARKFYERNGYEGIGVSAATTDRSGANRTGANRSRADGLSCDAMRKNLDTD